MQRAIRFITFAALVLIPVTVAAQNNCVPWGCFTPPGGCSYCDVALDNGNTECNVDSSGHICIMSGYCDTGLGGCDSDVGCAMRTIVPHFIWVEAVPRPLREEWVLVHVSVRSQRGSPRRS
jgi:hypothetical protein